MTTTKSIAVKIADTATSQRNQSEAWEYLDAACEKEGRIDERAYEKTRWVFEDGSAIVVCGGGFDVLHPDCTCGWCWDGAGAHCDEDEMTSDD